ncbi:CU044_2847 family protein [Streptomyces anatolicus]|uniref:CU044_2847 family protein n=1 Tax=Streptomyces anatolicus TaxID=2675858 RepID=UPI001CA47D2F|nr:CU044_2847 family protein [Streptomyces anatolicus]
MSELIRWESDQGPVVVEVDSRDPGFRSVSRRGEAGEVHEVEGRFEAALGHVRGAALSALRTFRERALDPDAIELEFGVKLTVAAGAVIAKTATEGHLTVRLRWSRDDAASQGAQEAAAVPPAGRQDAGHGVRQDVESDAQGPVRQDPQGG